MQKSILIPKRFSYIAAFLSLRCNLGCSYCINNYGQKILRKRDEKSSGEWLNALNRLKTERIMPITFQGGEPTLHKEFYEIVNGLREDIYMDLLTNLQFDTNTFIRRINPARINKNRIKEYKGIRVSFHSEEMSIDGTLRKAVELQNAGFNIGIFGINNPNSLEKNLEMTEKAERYKIAFSIKDFFGLENRRLFGDYRYAGGLNGLKKKVGCRTRALIIAPDLSAHRCYRDLYLSENPLGSLLDEEYVHKDIFRECNNFGTCNPCDLRSKGEDCAVEIKTAE